MRDIDQLKQKLKKEESDLDGYIRNLHSTFTYIPEDDHFKNYEELMKKFKIERGEMKEEKKQFASAMVDQLGRIDKTDKKILELKGSIEKLEKEKKNQEEGIKEEEIIIEDTKKEHGSEIKEEEITIENPTKNEELIELLTEEEADAMITEQIDIKEKEKDPTKKTNMRPLIIIGIIIALIAIGLGAFLFIVHIIGFFVCFTFYGKNATFMQLALWELNIRKMKRNI